MMSAGGGGGKNIEADGDEKFVQVLDIHQTEPGPDCLATYNSNAYS